MNHCKQCQKEIEPLEYYKYHYYCKSCWNEYCKSHRKYNPDVQRIASKKYNDKKKRTCKCCGLEKEKTEFEKHHKFCIVCTPPTIAEIKKKYAQSDVGKQKRREYDINKRKRIKEEKRIAMQAAAKERKLKQNAVIKTEKPIIQKRTEFIKVDKPIYQRIRVNDFDRPKKFVRPGWDKIMNEIKLKCQIV